MALRASNGAEAAVEVAALPEVPYGLVDVEFMQAAEERECVDGAVEEARVDLAPLVAREHARGLLERQDDCSASQFMALAKEGKVHI